MEQMMIGDLIEICGESKFVFNLFLKTIQCHQISNPMKFAFDDNTIGLTLYGFRYPMTQGIRRFDCMNFSSDDHAIGLTPLWIQISDPYEA
jgi:hypothetical protein